jgi:hypothetical protein
MRRVPRWCLWLLPPVWLGFAVGLWQRRRTCFAHVAGLPLVYHMALWGLGMGGGMLGLGLLLSGIFAVPPPVQGPSSLQTSEALLPTSGPGVMLYPSQHAVKAYVDTGLAFGTPALTCTAGDRLRVTPTGLSCAPGTPRGE